MTNMYSCGSRQNSLRQALSGAGGEEKEKGGRAARLSLLFRALARGLLQNDLYTRYNAYN